MIITMRHKKNADGLRDLIKDVPEGSMIEIGCYTGESTKIFYDSGKFDPVYAVDPWEGGYDDSRSANSDMKEVERLFDERIGHSVKKMKMTSKEASEILDNVDFIYIDGSHDYEAVKKDILLWKDRCNYLGLHDYGHRSTPGVTKAVHELLGKPHKTYKDTSCLFNL